MPILSERKMAERTNQNHVSPQIDTDETRFFDPQMTLMFTDDSKLCLKIKNTLTQQSTSRHFF